MKKLLLLGVLLLSGCSVNFSPSNSDKAAHISDLNGISDFHLNDGTRCVSLSNEGITCDWDHRSESK